MSGIEIDKKINWCWFNSALILAFGSIIFGILKGPHWIYVLSGIGLGIALLNIGGRFRSNSHYPQPILSLSLLAVHVLCLVAGFSLNYLFLSPLKDSSLKIPLLKQLYHDPQGAFVLTGPAGWIYTPSVTGVRINPVGFTGYMGASEINISVRLMEKAPSSPNAFLKKMASSMASKGKATDRKDKAFQLEIIEAQLLDKGTGVFAVMDVSRFWLPLRQVSLFGIKRSRYFCSISITGLKAHSTLFKVLSLGLFKSLEVK